MLRRISLGLFIRWSLRLLNNPIPQCRNLIGFQRFPFRRHPFRFVSRRDSLQQCTGLSIAGYDRGSRFSTFDRQRRRIKPQTTFLFQHAVTRNAAFKQDWLDRRAGRLVRRQRATTKLTTVPSRPIQRVEQSSTPGQIHSIEYTTSEHTGV